MILCRRASNEDFALCRWGTAARRARERSQMVMMAWRTGGGRGEAGGEMGDDDDDDDDNRVADELM